MRSRKYASFCSGVFLTPPVAGALLRADKVANCFLGPGGLVDFLAVCFVDVHQSVTFILSGLWAFCRTRIVGVIYSLDAS